MKLIYGMFLALSLSACSTSIFKDSNYERTNWLPKKELNEWLAKKDNNSYWDNGFWIVDVEGKATEKGDQYRVTTDKAPTDKSYWWFWWYG